LEKNIVSILFGDAFVQIPKETSYEALKKSAFSLLEKETKYK